MRAGDDEEAPSELERQQDLRTDADPLAGKPCRPDRGPTPPSNRGARAVSFDVPVHKASVPMASRAAAGAERVALISRTLTKKAPEAVSNPRRISVPDGMT